MLMSRPREIASPNVVDLYPGEPHALTASVQRLDAYNTQTLVVQPIEWQREAWNYFRALGELNFAIDSWLSNCVSRIKLVAAEIVPGSDEPTILTEGDFADIVAEFAGGQVNQSAVMKRASIQVSVPGDSYIVTEDDPILGFRTTKVYSSSEIRIINRRDPLSYQVMTQRNLWRSLSPEAIVSRCWWPDAEFAWRASSPCEAALPIMREIDMYNRYIMSVLLSRVSNNGIFFIPNEVTMPAKDAFKGQPDPFVAEWIDIATRATANPGSAASSLPMPISVPAEMIEKFRHLTFHTEMDDKVLDKRETAIGRLARTLNMPPEAMTGMGDVNHWGQWQISEDSVKIHIAPVVEVIVHALTETYAYPVAASLGVSLVGPNGGQCIMWYDASALYQQPDRSKEASDLNEKLIISDEATRRESGFDEKDKPSIPELREMGLRAIVAKGGPFALAALGELVNDPSLIELSKPPPPDIGSTEPGVVPTDRPGSPPQDEQGPPTEPADTSPSPTNVANPAAGEGQRAPTVILVK